MKKPLPISLAGRTLFILLTGLTFSHILSILIFTSEKLESAVLTSEAQVLTHMANLTRLLVAIPASLHEPVRLAMNRSGLHFEEVDPASSPDPESFLAAKDERLMRQLEKEIGSALVRVVAVTSSAPDWDHQDGAMHRLLFNLEVGIIRLMHESVLDRELRAWVALPAGHRILLSTRPAEGHVPLFRHATISVILMTGGIFLFSLVAVSHMTLPLRRVVQAVDTLGEDVYADPLPEEGSPEVVTVARALNRLNRKIREFVEERLRMVAAISHDLRTPLTKLKLMAEFVGDEGTRSRMVATLDEMASMLTATLSLARDATTLDAKQKVNLDGLLSAICADLADAGVPAIFEESGKHLGYCRPLAMKRALSNLIHNAVTYGGEARVFLRREGEDWVIDVRDPGPGIPEEAWEDVFRPFFRLDPSRSPDTGGVGLGLSIAASVVRDHGGVIRFAHLPGGGFSTQVSLPANPGQAAC